MFFFFSSRRRHTRWNCDWSSDVCSSDLRRIWARWLRDTYGATSPRAQWLRFHTQTAGVSLTAQQPDNNVVRTAIEALAAVLGGTNSLHTNALDEVLALPSEKA